MTFSLAAQGELAAGFLARAFGSCLSELKSFVVCESSAMSIARASRVQVSLDQEFKWMSKGEFYARYGEERAKAFMLEDSNVEKREMILDGKRKMFYLILFRESIKYSSAHERAT